MKQLLFKRKYRFFLYFTACFFPVINDLIRIGILSLLFSAIQKGEVSFFITITIIAISSVVVTGLIYIASRMMRISYMRDTILDVRIAAFDKILRTSYKQFSQKSKDVYISNLVNDINNFEKNFFINLLNFIYRAGIYIVSLVIILFIDPILALGMFLASVILFFVVKAFEKRTITLQKQVSTESETFTVNMANTFNGLEILKINNIEDKFITKSFDSINRIERVKYQFRFFTESQRNLSNMIGYVITVGVSVYLLSQMRFGLDLGKIMFLFQLSANITFALPDIFPRANVIRSSKDIYNKITVLEEEPDKHHRANDFRFKDKIEISDLSLSFDNKEIFKGASCTIEKGRKYLIKGPSGIGKSTLIKLLSMVLDEYEGRITIDGADIRTITEKTFNDKVAFIYQDVFLFEDTIRNNITLFKPMDEADVNDAAAKAGLSDFIQAREKGMNEMISENGKNLSGGERQRISIARAIAKKAEILFIDEGTSALNEELGREIEQTFLSLDSTVIAISHRYYQGVTDEYDYVLEIKDGKIRTFDAKTYFSEVTYA